LRRLILIFADLILVALATVLAIVLRGDVVSFQDKVVALIPYIFVTLGCASIIFLLGGVGRTPWRYTSFADHLRLIVLTATVILLAVVITFAANRLEGVARSLPILQGALIVIILVAARGAARLWLVKQIHANGNDQIKRQPHETVLIVGVNSISELFLLSVKEFASQLVQVAGVLAEEPGMRGRTIHQKPILGAVDELPDILQSLEVHGVTVDRLIVATPTGRLSPRALKTLLDVENSSDIVVQFLSERLGFENSFQRPSLDPGPEQKSIAKQSRRAPVENITDIHHVKSAGAFPRFGKRLADVLVAALLIALLSPIAILIVFIVALDVGFPVIFWQQRPGLHGRPFKLYKFRTMCAPRDEHQMRIPDDQRSSTVGRILRRIHFDELPQLYNVLVGEMSLIGPRPLLPRDQSPDYAARLSVRPGITGWAQVNGGRVISPSDKCILDIWYAQHLSLALDLKIALQTVRMVLFGDRINVLALGQARSDLNQKTGLRIQMVPAE
jgi:lipopolysaccharide/colanic/teichoic acid biosynthesis glycosyltransferase